MVAIAVSLLAAALAANVDVTAITKMRSPVAGVRVRFTPMGETKYTQEAVTDASGTSRIENMPPGDYQPWIDPPPGFFGPEPLALIRAPFHVGVDGAKFEVVLTTGGSIGGRVLDPDGKPVAHGRVEVLPINGFVGATGETDGEGRWRATALAPGRYRLRAKPADGKWTPTYYPNVSDPSMAEAVAVGEGIELTGLDIRVRAVPTHRLRGVVRGEDGQPAAGVDLSLTLDVMPEMTMVSGAEGTFEFAAVRAGDWRLGANLRRNGVAWKAAATIAMTNRDLDNVVLRLDPPFALYTEQEGLPTGSRAPVRALLRPAGGPALEQPSAYPGDDGRVRFPVVYPGRYHIDIGAFVPGYHVKSVFLGDREITDPTPELLPGVGPLRIVFAPNGARVTGELEGGAGGKVLLIAAEPNFYVPGPGTWTVTVAASSRFSLNDLRPGDWYAVAFDRVPAMNSVALRELFFQRGLDRRAELLRLKEGQVETVKLKILPWSD